MTEASGDESGGGPGDGAASRSARTGGRLALAGVAVLGLCASSPPRWFPGAELLVLVGWGAFFALATGPKQGRRGWWIYGVGVAHMLYFSFSVRHVLLPAYVAIGLLGGLYYSLTALWTRVLGAKVPPALAFGTAVAGACWLRGHCPEIQYPHVQPAHAFYHWPVVLGGLRVGGEVFMNLVVATTAAATVQLYRAWRLAEPGLRSSLLTWGAAVAVWVGSALVPGSGPGATRTVDLLLIEPALPPFATWEQWLERLREGVVAPTVAAAGPTAAAPPDLVIWPESVGLHRLSGSRERMRLDPVRGVALPRLHRSTRLLTGGLLQVDEGEGSGTRVVVALLLDHAGRYLGHHEKQHVVPGGEHAPFLDWLPAAWGAWIRDAFQRGMGVPLPETAPGQPRPLLETGDGVPFGAMVCFDNAFPDVSEDLSARGAAFLVVQSNENWYLGGAELDQMIAMTVCRALETGLPIVRCTVDGATAVVARDGRILSALPWPAPNGVSGRQLRVRFDVSAEPQRAVPRLRPWIEWAVLLGFLGAVALLLRSWVRIPPSKPPG